MRDLRGTPHQQLGLYHRRISHPLCRTEGRLFDEEHLVFLPLKAIGGVPVYRGKRKDNKHSLTESLTKAYAQSDSLAIAVTPEGTRSKNPNWHKGALVIAAEANVPLILAYIDYKNKIACLDKVLTLSGDIQADLNTIQRYYHDKGYMAKYPEKFSTGL